jgi:predicted transcriptional regulator
MKHGLDVPAWIRIIPEIEKGEYITTISKELDYTYSHVNDIITELCTQNLAYKEKVGRCKYVKLTKTGQILCVSCRQILEIAKPRIVNNKR